MTPKQLNSGHSMPGIGFGTWRMQGANCTAATLAALQAGYRQIDTAQVYDNEADVHAAIKQSGLKRDDLFITTKIWNENQYWDKFVPSVQKSLENLDTHYVDLLLLHFPVTETRRPAWRLMERAAEAGWARSIGVSNYTVTHLRELMAESRIKPAVNQVELHVFLQQPELLDYCRMYGIVVQAYSPLAHGERHDDPMLAKIAAKHHKTPTQIMLRWCIEVGTVPLPKAAKPEHISANLKIDDFELDAEDLAAMRGLQSDLRTCWDPTHVA